MANSQTKKPNKYVALATYLIAVVCLLLGLFLPLFAGKNILVLQLPNVIKQIANKENTFNLAYNVNLFGLGKLNVDIMAWVVLLYFSVTVLSLLALIPIGISTKRGTGTAHIFMYVVETASVIVLSVYVIIALQYQRSPESIPAVYNPLSNFCYNMLIALGGSLVALITLSLLYKKSTGFAKLVLFLLSSLGLLALYDFSLIIPKLANLKLVCAMYGSEGAHVNGIGFIDVLFNGDYKLALQTLPDAKSKSAMIFGTAVALSAMINFFIDVLALSTNAKRAGHVFNLIRYGLEIILALCLLITVAICKYEIGLLLIILAVAVLVQLEICIGRYFIYRKKAKKAKKASSGEDDGDDDEEDQIIMERVQRKPQEHYQRPAEPSAPAERIMPAREEPVQMEIMDIEPESVLMDNTLRQPKPADRQKPMQNVNPVYTPRPAHSENSNNVYGQDTVKPVRASQPSNEPHVYTINAIYGGPVDDFIRKLTNDEKIEFAMTFIEKSKGNVGNIPDYVIGGNNRKFFSAVFIYLGRIRGLISDGLLNKMYKELNML